MKVSVVVVVVVVRISFGFDKVTFFPPFQTFLQLQLNTSNQEVTIFFPDS